MNQIYLKVSANRLDITKDTVTTGGSENYDSCNFTFDSEWTGFTKTAVFASGSSDSYRVSLENNSCIIPSACIEKEGIIRIGVYGINNDGVVITTNSVAHHVNEGVNEVGEWIQEDYSLVVNAIKELKEYAGEYTQLLDTKFKNLSDKLLAQGGTVTVGQGACVPSDRYVPETYTNAADFPIVSNGATYDDFMNFRLEALVTDFPEYVSKKIIGKDSSGTYSVYAFSFEPENYDKTVFISSYIHGSDRVAFLALCLFLDELCRKNETDNSLGYIRNRVKLIVVPAVNPYGVSKVTTSNVNNVNIGYNFPYNWDVCTRSTKGAAAANQVETQNIISFLETIKNDKLCAAVEVHNSAITVAGRAVFYPKLHMNCASELSEMINSIASEYPSNETASKSVLAPSNNPTLTNYAADTYGINACELIWSTSVYGGVLSNECLTKNTEFIGNAVCIMAKNSKPYVAEVSAPFAKVITWKKNTASDVFSLTSSSLQKMSISALSLSMKQPCIITLNGYVKLSVTAACTVKINPVLYQINSVEQQYSDRLASTVFSHELELTPGTHIIPVSSVLQAYYSSYNDSNECSYCENIGFVFTFASSVSGAAAVTEYYINLNGTPSNLAKPVEICRPMGNVSDYSGNDVPTQTLIYPLGTYDRSVDSGFND